MVKRNLRKSRIIFPRKNEHLVFFLSLFIYLFKQIALWYNNSKTTKARNLKFGQMISVYMKLCTCNFGGVTSRGLGHMHPKLAIAKFIK